MNELWIIYALVFGAALLGIQASYWLIFPTRKAQKAINRRLALSSQGSSPTAVLETLRRERGFADFDNALLKRLNDFWTQTGLRLDRNMLAFMSFALGALFFIIFGLGFGLMALVLAPLAAAGTVFLFLNIVRNRRIARFAEQLPDAIEVIVRGVKVGYPFSSALTLVAREMPDPIGTEFGMTADEIIAADTIRKGTFENADQAAQQIVNL